MSTCHPERSEGSTIPSHGASGIRMNGRSLASLRMTRASLRMTRASLRMTLLLLALAGCERENRRYDDAPRQAITPRVSELQPGPTLILAKSEEGVYDDNAWGTTEGKRLFSWMNCSGCHA